MNELKVETNCIRLLWKVRRDELHSSFVKNA